MEVLANGTPTLAASATGGRAGRLKTYPTAAFVNVLQQNDAKEGKNAQEWRFLGVFAVRNAQE